MQKTSRPQQRPQDTSLIRLFIGIAPDADTQHFLDGICCEAGQRGLPKKVRWISHTNRHLTLAFLGETDPDHLETIEQSLAGIASGSPPLCGKIVSAHPFPRARAAMFAAELLPSPALTRLHRACQALMHAIGKAPERKTFRPHFTLARSRSGFSRPAPIPADFTCILDNLTLYQSLLAPEGSQYRSLLTLPLCGAENSEADSQA
ncbi:RNA 2',3'-cyclic phosphodiesterase [Microbulbifer elongatus]|uniref:RNA 2',3'-cyclic phosphodiesterase n=1 Tax=Microbulbifer elongatus TaxID=86173 RepID=UPI001E580E97|nr:RNA 2',3'-cyclic phosphodiesterase [Microbulbifer elongatus]